MILAMQSDAQRLPLFRLLESRDPTARKHGGAPTSEKAHAKIRPHKRRIYAQILRLYRGAASTGITAKELAVKLGKPLHAVSGRLTELRQWGFLFRIDLKREDSFVLVHRYFRQSASW